MTPDRQGVTHQIAVDIGDGSVDAATWKVDAHQALHAEVEGYLEKAAEFQRLFPEVCDE